MPGKTYFHYILFACALQNSFIHSMDEKKPDMLQIQSAHGTAIDIYPTPQTWSSFTRQKLKDELDADIKNNQNMGKITITASGENVALALQCATENRLVIDELILKNPKINIANIDPLNYYRGNFPLFLMDKSKLSSLLITIQHDGQSSDNDAKALIQLCLQAQASITIPHHLNQWHEHMKDSNAELNNIIFMEKFAWISNKISIIVTLGLLYLLSKRL